MRPAVQLLWRSLAGTPWQARIAAHTPQLRALPTARSFQTSPFFRLFARNQSRLQNRHFFRTNRRWYTEPAKQGPGSTTSSTSATAAEPHGLSARLRKLTREYGWSAFGVYMALTALDFPFCFLAVRQLGTERIGHWEHAIVEWMKRAIPFQWPKKWGGSKKGEQPAEPVDGALVGYDHGVREAEKSNQGDDASIWTQLALAYAIHKSFIFIRVPLTAAITPNVVRTLRGWGWNIGKIKPKAERVAARAEREATKTRGGGR